MLDAASKTFFHLLAGSRRLKSLATRYGMRSSTSFARRFIAGETLAEAIDAGRALERRGMAHTLDRLGESVSTVAEAREATRAYLETIDAVTESGIGRNLSLKLTQLGVDLDEAEAVQNLRTILERARGFFIRIDMESSRYTDTTLRIFEQLWHEGYRHVGVVLQSALYRSERDLQRMIALGARVRLVKGAYSEPSSIAYQKKADVDSAYTRMMRLLLAEGHYPAFATHDPVMIDRARRFADEHGVAANRFEFQMLYGIRRDLQARLVDQGYTMRIYVPFGQEWFPYVMRRLGERPANVAFVLRGAFRTGSGG
jgi:proline dehydrogenase